VSSTPFNLSVVSPGTADDYSGGRDISQGERFEACFGVLVIETHLSGVLVVRFELSQAVS